MKSITGNKELDDALWAGDVDRLQELAYCRCCCDEHTFSDCPARLWGACRGQGAITHADKEAWAKFYGMTIDEFLNPT
jgi:hypothetical protein